MPHVSAETLASLDVLMQRLDLNGDGVISCQEWMTFVVHRRLGLNEERLYQAFKKLDVNGDGKISLPELQQVLGAETDVDVASFMTETDANHDGEIDFQEFLAMWYHENVIQSPLLPAAAAAGSSPQTMDSLP